MPYKSDAQRRWMFAAEARGEVARGTAKRWAHHTKNMEDLPEHVSDDKKEKAAAFGTFFGKIAADLVPTLKSSPGVAIPVGSPTAAPRLMANAQTAGTSMQNSMPTINALSMANRQSTNQSAIKAVGRAMASDSMASGMSPGPSGTSETKLGCSTTMKPKAKKKRK